MNDREQIGSNNAALKEKLADIPALMATGNFDAAMQQLYAAGNHAWLNSCGQLASVEIEDLIVQLSKKLPANQNRPRPATGQAVATILTSIHAAGGHSRLAWRWIQLDRERLHHVILTNQGNTPLPSQMQELIDAGRVTLSRLDDTTASLWDRSLRLRQLVQGAESVVLHIHPDDPVAPVALARMEAAPPVIFVDHATHVFWLGACAANLILTLGTEACRTTTTRRGVPSHQTCWWPLSVDLPRLDMPPKLSVRQHLNIPEDSIILLTSGWSYKFHPIEGHSFSKAIAPVLEARPSAHLIAVGPTADDWAWEDLRDRFSNRIHLQGVQDEEFMIACYHACDIYLDSIPFSSGGAVREVAAVGKPIIKFATQEMRDCGFAADFDTVPLPMYSWTDLKSYRDNLLDLIDMSPKERAILGTILRNSIRNWHSEEVCQFFLEKAYRQAKHSARIQIDAELTRMTFDPLDRLLIALGNNTRKSLEMPAYMSWVTSCKITNACAHYKQFEQIFNSVSIELAIFTTGSKDLLDKTLASVKRQCRKAENVYVASTEAPIHLHFEVSQAAWTLLLCEGDTLEEDALFLLEKAIAEKGNNEALVAYFDHDEIGGNGLFTNPHLKPGFNHDLLMSYPYIGRALVVRTSWARAYAAKFKGGANLPLAYSIALLAANQMGARGFIHLPAVIAHLDMSEPGVFASTSEMWQLLANTINCHVGDMAPGAQISEGPGPGTFHLVHSMRHTPLVSIVIPTRDQLSLLTRCIESLFEKTDYPDFEILIVDNDSQTTEVKDYLRALAELDPNKIRVLSVPGPFNFSRMNNLAVAQARGEFILMLNNDTAALQPDWLSHMMRHALRKDVGIVGARLVYPDGKLQHAGVVMGLRGPADHPNLGMDTSEPGYLFRNQVTQNFSAVTAACMLVSKALYVEVGGLDEDTFGVSYNDVDFCLRVGKTGRRIVWTPLATLLHEGSASQRAQIEATTQGQKLQRFSKEQAAMYLRWPEVIANDPAYNPNLSLVEKGYEIETNPLLHFNKLLGLTPHRVVAFAADNTGCGHYRMLQPMQAMVDTGLCTGGASPEMFGPNLVLRSGADRLVFQRPSTDDVLEVLSALLPLKGIKKIYELDDNIARVPIKSAHKSQIATDIRARTSKAMGLCDRLVVSTEALAQELRGKNDDIRVVMNRLPQAMWGTEPPNRPARQLKPGTKPRVGWAGGAGHQGDLEMIFDVVKDLADKVDWVFVGMVPEALRPYVHQFDPGVPTLDYPKHLMQLSASWDLAIAPLELNAFNECKSNLKLLEYGWCGVPVVCSDITPYQGNLPCKLVKNRYLDWRNAILAMVSDLENCHSEGLRLQSEVKRDWMLDGANLQAWYEAWTD